MVTLEARSSKPRCEQDCALKTLGKNPSSPLPCLWWSSAARGPPWPGDAPLQSLFLFYTVFFPLGISDLSPYRDTNYTGSGPHPYDSFALNYLHHGLICKYSRTVLGGWLRGRHFQSIRDPHGRLQRAAHLSLSQPQTRVFPQDLLSLPLTMKRPAKKTSQNVFRQTSVCIQE